MLITTQLGVFFESEKIRKPVQSRSLYRCFLFWSAGRAIVLDNDVFLFCYISLKKEACHVLESKDSGGESHQVKGRGGQIKDSVKQNNVRTGKGSREREDGKERER